MPLPSTRTRIVSSDVTPTTTYSNSSRAEYRLPGRESVSPTIASTRPEYTTRSSCNVHSDGMYPYFVLACLCKRGILHLYGRRQEVFGVERVRMCGGTRRVRAAYPRPSLNPFLRSALRLRAEFGCTPMTRFPSLSSPFSLPRARRARFYLFPRPSARSYARLRKWVDEAYGDAMYFSIRVHGDEAGDGDGDGDRGWRALASFPGLVLHAPRKRPRASMYAYARRRCLVSVSVAAWGRLLFWDWMTMGIATIRAPSSLARLRHHRRLRKGLDEAYGDATYFSIRVHGNEAGDGYGYGYGYGEWRARARSGMERKAVRFVCTCPRSPCSH
ncbi:hypothetical protein C8F04DRAFT_364531 [Mycena alexandri]|uniref:Uncharacterized protein n=1 Tax=Mycena alexandri TaxID=1745969 RepID=A0AAD6WPB7_9AGAR|nr:hypothetical protein C8F04DRAFT_364531 [Mycena alexandri]